MVCISLYPSPRISVPPEGGGSPSIILRPLAAEIEWTAGDSLMLTLIKRFHLSHCVLRFIIKLPLKKTMAQAFYPIIQTAIAFGAELAYNNIYAYDDIK